MHTMVSRQACIQGVFKVKVKVKGHEKRALLWILGMSYSVIDGLVLHYQIKLTSSLRVNVQWCASLSCNRLCFVRTESHRAMLVCIRSRRPTAARRPPTEMTSMTSLLASLPVIIIRERRAPTVTSLRTSRPPHNRRLTSTTSSGVQSQSFAVASAPPSLRHDLTVTSRPPTNNHSAARL